MITGTLARLARVLLFGPNHAESPPKQCERTISDEDVEASRREWRESVHDMKNAPMRAATHLRMASRDAKETFVREGNALEAAKRSNRKSSEALKVAERALLEMLDKRQNGLNK